MPVNHAKEFLKSIHTGDVHLRKMNMTPLAILGVKWPFSKGHGR